MSNSFHCFLSESLLTFEFLAAPLLTSLAVITAHGNLSALLLFIPNEPESRKRTKTNVSLKWLYVWPKSCCVNQKQRGMFIYMEMLGNICLMSPSLSLPNTVKRQHHFSDLWFNGQFALPFLSRATGELQDSGCRSAVKSQRVNPPFLSKHTFSAFLWGGEKSFVILMGVKYVFQIY